MSQQGQSPPLPQVDHLSGHVSLGGLGLMVSRVGLAIALVGLAVSLVGQPVALLRPPVARLGVVFGTRYASLFRRRHIEGTKRRRVLSGSHCLTASSRVGVDFHSRASALRGKGGDRE